MSQAIKLREKNNTKIAELEEGKSEAKVAATDIINLLEKHRVVCVNAETQMGKTTICRLVAKRLINKLDDQDLMKIEHNIVVYIENVANNDLADQAEENFEHLSSNVVVLAVTRADSYIETLSNDYGITFIIDESHMGSDQLAKRLNSIFGRIEDRNNEADRIILVSATGFSSIYEAAREKNIMGYSAAIKVVTPSPKYRGINSFINSGQIINNSEEPCLVDSRYSTPAVYDEFISVLKKPSGGLYIIRSSAGKTQETKELLLSIKNTDGSPLLYEQNIKIVASSLKDVDKSELESWDSVVKKYNNYKDRNQKLVVIVRGFLRVGIAMPPEMKEDLTATWDGTSSAVSSVVQALVGRACGYHQNKNAKHFAHESLLTAHCQLSNKLSEFSKEEEVKLQDIVQAIQNITDEFGIPNWDPGLAGTDRRKVKSRLQNKLKEPQHKVEGWAAYSFDPNSKLKAKDTDIKELFCSIKQNNNYIPAKEELIQLTELIEKIHRQYDPKNGEIPIKSGRRMSVKYVSGQYINKNTFVNPKHGQRRKLETALTNLKESEDDISFNELRTQGAGKKTVDKIEYIAYVLSIYNAATLKDVDKKAASAMNEEMLNSFCINYGIQPNKTVIILFKKGNESASLTKQLKMQFKNKDDEIKVDGSIVRKSVFSLEQK